MESDHVHRLASARLALRVTGYCAGVLLVGAAPAWPQNTGHIYFTDVTSLGGVPRYPLGRTQVTVWVYDPDRNASPALADSIRVLVTSPDDVLEDLALVETGPATDRFEGSMPLEVLGAGSGALDGRLQGRIGQSVEARYHDPSDDFGNPRDLTTTALLAGLEGPVQGTLSHTGNPYVVTGELVVPEDAGLLVEPGVELRFLPGVCCVVRGDLTVAGTLGDEVRFTAHEQGPPVENWGDLEIYASLGNLAVHIDHAVFEFGGRGRQTMLSSQDRTLVLSECVVRGSETSGVGGYSGTYELANTDLLDNTRYGLWVHTQVRYQGGTVRGNGSGGIYLAGGALGVCSVQDLTIRDNGSTGVMDLSEGGSGGISIAHCRIVDNAGYGVFKGWQSMYLSIGNSELHGNAAAFDLYNDSGIEVTARFNWWGEATTAEMNLGGNPKDILRIYDSYDDPAKGFVNYSAWLQQPIFTAVAPTSWTDMKRRYR